MSVRSWDVLMAPICFSSSVHASAQGGGTVRRAFTQHGTLSYKVFIKKANQAAFSWGIVARYETLPFLRAALKWSWAELRVGACRHHPTRLSKMERLEAHLLLHPWESFPFILVIHAKAIFYGKLHVMTFMSPLSRITLFHSKLLLKETWSFKKKRSSFSRQTVQTEQK